MVAANSLADNLSFDFMGDFEPVAGVSNGPLLMLMHPSVPVNSLAEFIAYAKANPSKINFASAGNGSDPHLAGELFKMMAGVQMTHVPYRGGALAFTDLLGGNVQMMFTNLPAAEYIKTGKLRAIAVAGRQRMPQLPNVPTLIEIGIPDFEVSSWNGLFAPAGTPQPIIDRLAKATIPALHSPGIRQQFIDLGSVPVGSTPEEFKQYVHDEVIKWAEVAKAANVSID